MRKTNLLVSVAILAVVAVVAASRIALTIPRDHVALSTTRVDDLEITGTTEAGGEVTAQSGVRLTTPATGPIVTSGVGSPDGVVSATEGSLYLQTDTAAVYQNTDGASAWTEVGTGGGGGGWQLVIDDPLTGGSLAGWNQRNCAWTADGTGFHVAAAGECYLSYESGGVENAPFPMHGIIMEFEAAYPAGTATTEALGAVVFGQAATIATTGSTRFAITRNGTLIQLSAYPSNQAAITTSLGTLPTGTWYPIKLVATSTSVSIWFNGTFYGTLSVAITYAITRIGFWAGSRGDFRNLKIYRRSD